MLTETISKFIFPCEKRLEKKLEDHKREVEATLQTIRDDAHKTKWVKKK